MIANEQIARRNYLLITVYQYRAHFDAIDSLPVPIGDYLTPEQQQLLPGDTVEYKVDFARLLVGDYDYTHTFRRFNWWTWAAMAAIALAAVAVLQLLSRRRIPRRTRA